MFESLLVPYTLFIENEYFFGFHITENQVLIEHVSGPHKLVWNGFGWDLFKIFDINVMSLNKATKHSLMEDNLLSMRDKLCVPSEISLLNPSSWNEQHRDQRWQQQVASMRH